MPYVSIQVTREGSSPGADAVTKAQKAELISGITELLASVLNKSPATTFVVIDEVEMENWGIGGKLVEDYRKVGTK